MDINKGDIIEIDGGRHIIICGSCLSDSFNSLLDRISIELCLTDPPYGVDLLGRKNTIGNGKSYKRVHGDKNTLFFAEFYRKRILGQAIEKMIVFGGNYFANILPPERGWVTWYKHSNGKLSFAKSELIYTNLKYNADVIEYRWSGASIDPTEKSHGINRFHPTQKPIGLLKQLIEKADIGGGYIIDGFAGSLSTMFAAEICGKKAIVFELDESYVKEALAIYSQKYPEQIIKKRQMPT